MLRILIVAFGAFLAAASSEATVVVPADLGDLSREAFAIVRGTVVAVEARLMTGDRSAIETVVTLANEASLKGPLGSTVQFRVPGGRLGRYRKIVVGAPEFAPGQRVIVFLGASGPAIPFVLGLSQGTFRLAPDAGGWVVTPPAVLPVASATRIVRGDPARRPMKLADFEQQVRALAAGATP
jgi:hypothetical protein